ncbi:MAG: SPOR domain-containing protein [Brumimicrobium sp.]
MQYIRDILFELLLRNDCVIIPSLGGFVTNYVSAKVDVQTGIIFPPSKAVSFNKNLILNDGLMINFLAEKEKISYEEAQFILRKEVQQINESLNNNERIQFQNVGFLYQSKAGKVLFEQDRFFNLLLSSYGLRSVEFVPEKSEEPVIEQKQRIVHQNKSKQQEKVNVSEQAPIITHPAIQEHQSPKKIIGKIIKYTAVAALIPLLFYGLWIPMKTDVLKSGVLYSADFNPFKSKITEKYIPSINHEELMVNKFTPSNHLENITANLTEETEVFSYPVGVDLFLPVKNSINRGNNSDEKVQSSSINDLTEKSVTQIHSLHAIVGCFGDVKNAKKLIEDLQNKGYQAYEVDVKGGLHRISAGNVKDMAEMEALRQKLSLENFSSWVLRK